MLIFEANVLQLNCYQLKDYFSVWDNILIISMKETYNIWNCLFHV